MEELEWLGHVPLNLESELRLSLHLPALHRQIPSLNLAVLQQPFHLPVSRILVEMPGAWRWQCSI
jgi:hypothetical protein